MILGHRYSIGLPDLEPRAFRLSPILLRLELNTRDRIPRSNKFVNLRKPQNNHDAYT